MIRLILVGFLLMGCGMFCPPHFDNHPRAYTTERNGVRLPWELRVWNPNKTVLKAVYTNTAPGGVVGPFDWERRPDGDCVQMTFTVRPDMTNIGSRDVVQLNVDGVNAFYGVVTAPYDSSGTTGFQYVAEGGRDWFAKTYPSKRAYSNVTDLSSIITASDGYKTALPGPVAYNASKIQTSLGAITTWSFPKSLTLTQIMDKLAGLAATTTPVTWGVDAEGEFFFREPSGTTTVGFSGQMIAPISVDAKNTISKASIILSSTNPFTISSFGDVPGASVVPTGTNDHPGDSVIYSYADPQHATYNAEQSFQLGFVDPFTKGVGWVTPSASNLTNSANAYDNNDATYADNTAVGGFSLDLFRNTNPEKVVGIELLYSAISAVDVRFDMYVYRTISNYHLVSVPIQATGDHTRIKRLKLIFQYQGAQTVTQVRAAIGGVAGANAAGDFRIYEVQYLEWSAAIDNAAKAQILLPSTVAQQINLNGIQPPSKTLALQSTPNGDVTGPTASWKYSLASSADNLTGHKRTVVDVGNRDGSQTAQQFKIQSATLDSRQQGDIQPFLVPR